MTTDADGWIEHDGKGMPVDEETRVEVRLRDGKEGPCPAYQLFWWECDNGTITHYRIVDEAKPAATATKVTVDAMTVWDHYAMAALTGLLAANAICAGSRINRVELAADAGRIADAMMTVRVK